MKQPELYSYHLGQGVTTFSTSRRGGYSTGSYGEFNINPYCGDDPVAVARNREALCQVLHIGDDRLLLPHQTHGTQVACIDEKFLNLDVRERQRMLEGVDAMVTQMEGVCIGVSTADCIPVLLYDERRRVIAAIHAGWRGTVARIVQTTVRVMQTTYGTQPEDLRAHIGPGISLDSFEVGQEVYDAFQQAGFDMSLISRRYLKAESAMAEERWHLDLPVCNRLQMLAAGLRPEAITETAVCTYRHPDVFFSARRLGIHSGRIYTGILLHAR